MRYKILYHEIKFTYYSDDIWFDMPQEVFFELKILVYIFINIYNFDDFLKSFRVFFFYKKYQKMNLDILRSYYMFIILIYFISFKSSLKLNL
jgi:hypothetical protein